MNFHLQLSQNYICLLQHIYQKGGEQAEALTNQAYEYLYRKIVSCEYLPGQELNEKQLLEETSFGRTPLREALLMLQAENLIDIFPRKGMRITPFTEKSIDDLYQTRKLIEPTVCRKYISMYSKSRLLEYLKQFEKAAARSRIMMNFRSIPLFIPIWSISPGTRS